MIPSCRIYPLGDRAITLSLGNVVDKTINSYILALFQSLQEKPLAGIIDLLPAYCSLTVVYDFVRMGQRCERNETPFQLLERELTLRLSTLTNEPVIRERLVRIPVCYDPLVAPDLEAVARQHQLSMSEVAQLHSATIYRVYLIGFLPGFPYLGTVDKRIATPRKETPRIKVAAGSVGIAGDQTGIYPFASPGGWQLIGQTPLTLFDPASDQPTLLQPGDEVQFYPISLSKLQQLKTA